MSSKYTYAMNYGARYAGRVITIPDQVASDQRGWDLSGRSFPAIDDDGRRLRVRLHGRAYGLHTTGTGDPVCRSIANRTDRYKGCEIAVERTRLAATGQFLYGIAGRYDKPAMRAPWLTSVKAAKDWISQADGVAAFMSAYPADDVDLVVSSEAFAKHGYALDAGLLIQFNRGRYVATLALLDGTEREVAWEPAEPEWQKQSVRWAYDNPEAAVLDAIAIDRDRRAEEAE